MKASNYTLVGALCGLILALIWILGGMLGIFIALILTALGTVIGAHFDGRINLGQILNNGRKGRG
ncbi:MAG: DUF2273 domain-containing protein [Corynebacterium sp.]|nr:DUF2273 domain-containing protein [Corynebacterium sp.]